MVVDLDGRGSAPISVEYAAAGLTVCDAATPNTQGALVLFGAFGDGRVTPDLDLSTLSMSIDLADLPLVPGPADFDLDADAISLYLEADDAGESRLLAVEQLQGQVRLRYDAPPRPGMRLEGVFHLTVQALVFDDAGVPSRLTLEGSFDLPVVGSCS
jgi:hypothetical protein